MGTRNYTTVFTPSNLLHLGPLRAAALRLKISGGIPGSKVGDERARDVQRRRVVATPQRSTVPSGRQPVDLFVIRCNPLRYGTTTFPLGWTMRKKNLTRGGSAPRHPDSNLTM